MPEAKQQIERPEKIDFHYRKSPHFRTVRVDGATGGLSPHNEIQLSVYGDYAPDPDMVSHELIDGGVLGKEVGRLHRQGIVREIEFTATMNVDTAEALVNWLQEKIRIARGENSETPAGKTEQ